MIGLHYWVGFSLGLTYNRLKLTKVEKGYGFLGGRFSKFYIWSVSHVLQLDPNLTSLHVGWVFQTSDRLVYIAGQI